MVYDRLFSVVAMVTEMLLLQVKLYINMQVKIPAVNLTMVYIFSNVQQVLMF